MLWSLCQSTLCCFCALWEYQGKCKQQEQLINREVNVMLPQLIWQMWFHFPFCKLTFSIKSKNHFHQLNFVLQNWGLFFVFLYFKMLIKNADGNMAVGFECTLSYWWRFDRFSTFWANYKSCSTERNYEKYLHFDDKVRLWMKMEPVKAGYNKRHMITSN